MSIEIMSKKELDSRLDFKTVVRVNATLTCPRTCAVCTQHLKDVETTRLATLVCMTEFYPFGEPWNGFDVNTLLAQHGILIFPYCDINLYHAQTQIMTGEWFYIIFVCIHICIIDWTFDSIRLVCVHM